jgi:co-chaperonin GroES (HSP10)
VRPYADNVWIELEPQATQTASGLFIPQQSRAGARGSRFARVLASGAGHYRQVNAGAKGTQDGIFVPNETREGDRVLVDAMAGQAWDGENSAPRHNKGGDFGDRRVVREDEILAIVYESDG